MSALLTREGLSDLLRRGVRADLPDAVQAAHECLRDMGVAPTLPAMPRDPKRYQRRIDALHVAQREAAAS